MSLETTIQSQGINYTIMGYSPCIGIVAITEVYDQYGNETSLSGRLEIEAIDALTELAEEI